MKDVQTTYLWKGFFLPCLLIILWIVPDLSATIIHVRDDYRTIREALDNAGARDTILIQDGRYIGDDNTNLDIGSALVIMSEDGPANCVIDMDNNNQGAYAFRITSGATLIGITVQNGTSSAIQIENANGFYLENCYILTSEEIDEDTNGGGIIMDGSSGIIKDCLIRDNVAIRSGAGIYAANSDLELINCFFLANSAERFGGGVLLTANSDGEITNCVFDGNSTLIDGGGVALTQNSDADIFFTDFLNNRATGMGGGLYKGTGSNSDIINSIFYNNSADEGNQFMAQNNGTIRISFSFVDRGIDEDEVTDNGGRVEWDDEDIISEEDPMLDRGRNPDVGLDGYFLEEDEDEDEDSPCIDAGSDSAEELGMTEYTTLVSLEPDTGQVDIGYHYLIDDFTLLGRLMGSVDEYGGRAIDLALITTSLGQQVETDRRGEWVIEEAVAERPFDITVSAPGYNDTTVTDLFLRESETLELNFELLHPEFYLMPEFLEVNVFVGDSTEEELKIVNYGTGLLEWKAEKRPPGGPGFQRWDRMASLTVGDSNAIASTRVEGVAFVGDYFYVSAKKSRNEENAQKQIFVLDREGVLLDSFPQPIDSSNSGGMKDLTWDGEYLWGSGENNIIAFTTEGDSVRSFQGLRSQSTLTWDPDREWIWVSGITTDIYGFTLQGEEVARIDRQQMRIYGLTYNSDDPDGFPLYVNFSHRDSGGVWLGRVDPATEQILDFRKLVDRRNGRAGGSFITTEYDSYSEVYISVINHSTDISSDRLDIFYLRNNVAWLMLDEDAGEITAQDSVMFSLRFNSLSFEPGDFLCDLVFTHNAGRRYNIIPITMRIGINSIGDKKAKHPSKFEITGIYPNPFNNLLRVTYAIPELSSVSLTVYDLTGRQVGKLAGSMKAAGVHTSMFDGKMLASGLYIIRLEADQHVSQWKVALIR